MSEPLGPIGQAIFDAHKNKYPDGLLKTPEAAHILRLRETYLQTLRCKGGGPAFVRLGARIYYQLHVLAAWADSRARECQ